MYYNVIWYSHVICKRQSTVAPVGFIEAVANDESSNNDDIYNAELPRNIFIALLFWRPHGNSMGIVHFTKPGKQLSVGHRLREIDVPGSILAQANEVFHLSGVT